MQRRLGLAPRPGFGKRALGCSCGLALAWGASPARAQDPAPPAPPVEATPPPPASTPSPSPPPPTVTSSIPETEPTPPAKTNPPGDVGRFELGSYGRVQVASDGRGGTGRQANVVSHGTRIDEDSYAEIELRREDTFAGNIKSKVVTTLALFPPFFHFSGNMTNAIAVRNLYAQATYGQLTLWGGSRMYRGDDIYLLDWWPLDNQNTVGGGAGISLPTDTVVAAHVGLQRLDNSYQYEQIPVVSPYGFGSTNVTLLDRPRTIETLKITQFFRNDAKHHYLASDSAGLKAILYGEVHELPAGVYQDKATQQQLPYHADSGFLVGGELAYWTGERDTFVQLFARHARGLAAYDPLEDPTTYANDKTTSGSSETLIALGGNWEHGMFGLLGGAYMRFFRDGDPASTSLNKFDEGTMVLRPQLFLGDNWGVALEGSFQERRYAVLDPATDQPLTAQEWRGGVIPYFSPSGRGSYKRPQLRLIYAITARNAGARALYPAQDVFAQRQVEHYLGLGVEWWFNSSSYP